MRCRAFLSWVPHSGEPHSRRRVVDEWEGELSTLWARLLENRIWDLERTLELTVA